MTIDEAKQYISYVIKEGTGWDEETLLTLSDTELIAFAEEQADRADAYWENRKEESV